ncbi:lipocalin family protein [Alteromonas sp. 1_MG-2023]|uniref:lipocalin family protein n=1 Tax=Alteromonas sp. 1_MG-2023 TaxID=3062669 RepID=UPI0026E1ECBB|nr:lipocalin family protein [Alteromonas sp. 1_MG-2023]MDO6569163.1 lipocalin family protein [Alteromonas sp. 1_MG-2023]
MFNTLNTYEGIFRRLFSKQIKKWVAVTLLFSLFGCTSVPDGVTPVDEFELDRYLGQWYEVARFNHSFEEGLSNVTATYSMREDGGVKVINRGYSEEEGKWDEAEGRAYFVSSPNTAHLKVSFFGPFYASYVVMALDKEGYEYAMVTGPDREYLWILAREKTLPQDTINRLLAQATQKGYDTDKLIWVSQEAP